MTDVRIKSFHNNSLVTYNSLYRLSSRKSHTFFKSALTGLCEVSSTVPSFENSQFYLTFAGNRCGSNVLLSPSPLDTPQQWWIAPQSLFWTFLMKSMMFWLLTNPSLMIKCILWQEVQNKLRGRDRAQFLSPSHTQWLWRDKKRLCARDKKIIKPLLLFQASSDRPYLAPQSSISPCLLHFLVHSLSKTQQWAISVT